MLTLRQNEPDADQASVPVAGRKELWSPGRLPPHRHVRHQMLYAAQGVVHISTNAGRWILPTSRILWISGGTEHSLLVKNMPKLRFYT